MDRGKLPIVSTIVYVATHLVTVSVFSVSLGVDDLDFLSGQWDVVAFLGSRPSLCGYTILNVFGGKCVWTSGLWWPVLSECYVTLFLSWVYGPHSSDGLAEFSRSSGHFMGNVEFTVFGYMWVGGTSRSLDVIGELNRS